MDANQWPLGLDVLKPVETSKPPVVERKPRPQKEQALNCPRCNSTNTKFCYYNNYNLSQPRYFCKTCRRYWTEGGTLRNVPVGGGSRKNKRSSTSTSTSINSSSSSSSSLLKKLPDLTTSTSGLMHPPQISFSQNPKFHGGQDLNLAFDHNLHSGTTDHVYNTSSSALPLSFGEGKGNTTFGFDPNPNHLMPSSLELLKEVGVSSMGLGLVGSMPSSMGSAVLLPNAHTNDYFKPRFNFCLDGQLDHMGINYGNGLLQQQQQQQQQVGHVLPETNTTRFFHPYEDGTKQFTTTSSSNDQYEQQNKGQGESNGYWSGMLGGGSW